MEVPEICVWKWFENGGGGGLRGVTCREVACHGKMTGLWTVKLGSLGKSGALREPFTGISHEVSECFIN